MRHLIIIAAFLAIALTGGLRGGLNAAEFIAGFEDVPMMPGMKVDDDASTTFDTPTGRIVEAYAAGDVTADAVQRFYLDTLPQLGWTITSGLQFQREGESLTLEMIDKGTLLTVRFRLAPVSN